eukprot:51868-Eustigmatos_ZCMA.PRE.1
MCGRRCHDPKVGDIVEGIAPASCTKLDVMMSMDDSGDDSGSFHDRQHAWWTLKCFGVSPFIVIRGDHSDDCELTGMTGTTMMTEC